MARDSVNPARKVYLILIAIAALSGSAVAIGNYKAAITMGRAGSWVSATGGYPAVEGMVNVNGTPTWHNDGGAELPMVPVTTGVTAATYTNASITVDKYGRITSAVAGAAPGAGYNVIESNGTVQTARSAMNLISADVSCADNSGSARTDCTINPLALVNVKSYGAKADGTTDDTAAIASAVTAANGVGEVYFPPSTLPYIVKNLTITIAGTKLRGGRGATLKLPVEATGTGSPIINVQANGAEIRWLAFDGNKAAQPADGFSDSFAGGTNGTGRAYRAAIMAYKSGSTLTGFTVDHCAFTGTYGAAIAMKDVQGISITDNTHTNSYFETGYLDTSLAEGSYLTDVKVTGNYTQNIGSGDANVNANAFVLTQVSNAVFANNYANTVERNIVKVQGSRGVAIAANVLDTNTKDNFDGLQLQNASSDIVMIGNKLYNTGSGIALNYNSLAGAHTLGYHNILITGNTIDTTTGSSTPDGIVFEPGVSSDGITISNNTMRGVGRYGVYLNIDATTNDITVTNNRIATTGTVNGGGIAIQAGANISGYSVLNNYVNLGSVNVNASGLQFWQVGGFQISNANVVGNTVLTGGGNKAITTQATAIASGALWSNLTDGLVSVTGFTETFSTGVVFGGGATASGASAIDLSGSSGTFGTPTGNFTFNGQVAGNITLTTATHTLLANQSGIDTGGSTVTYTSGQGGTASATGGGTGGQTNFAAANGGNGTGALNPGGGGAAVLVGGNAGTGGSGNASGGSAFCRGGVKQGTGVNGKCVLGDANTSEIDIGASGIPTKFIGTTFAALPSSPANGMFLYCSDCTIANPCASGGTGAFAKRLNSAWVCN